jgi:hypothetical protein
MIEVFKTTVESSTDAEILLTLLRSQDASLEVNFDLEDCDHILRVKGGHFCIRGIIKLLTDSGFECIVLK